MKWVLFNKKFKKVRESRRFGWILEWGLQSECLDCLKWVVLFCKSEYFFSVCVCVVFSKPQAGHLNISELALTLHSHSVSELIGIPDINLGFWSCHDGAVWWGFSWQQMERMMRMYGKLNKILSSYTNIRDELPNSPNPAQPIFSLCERCPSLSPSSFSLETCCCSWLLSHVHWSGWLLKFIWSFEKFWYWAEKP